MTRAILAKGFGVLDGSRVVVLASFAFVCVTLSGFSQTASALLITHYEVCRALAAGPDPRADCNDPSYATPMTNGIAGHYESDSVDSLGIPVHSVFDASASAIADFGVLGAAASATLTDYRAGTYFPDFLGPSVQAADAHAIFLDTVTIDGAAGDAFLDATFAVDRTIESALPPGAGGPFGVGAAAALSKFHCPSPLPCEAFDGTWFIDSGHSIETLTYPFTFGVPFQFGAYVESMVEVLDLFLFADTYDFSGTADLLDTAALGNLLVRDGSGNPIPGVTLSDESGTRYPLDARNRVPVPVPATLALFAFGLAGLGFCRLSTLFHKYGNI